MSAPDAGPTRDFGRFLTEQRNPRTMQLDAVPLRDALRIINDEDAQVAGVVRGEIDRIAEAVDLIVERRRRDGRIYFVGAGTSGRLGVIEAAEQTPTLDVPDPIYQSPLVTRFINCLMVDGKKSVAEQIFYGAMTIVQDKTSEDPVKIFRKAIDNVKPALEVKSRRVGGSNYQVPVEVRPERRTALAIRWMISYSRARSEKSMRERLASEVLDASAMRGAAVKKREDTHKMAEANKAFAHYRW